MIVKFLRRVWHRRNVYNSRTKSPASILRFTCWNFIGYFYEFHFIIERRATCTRPRRNSMNPAAIISAATNFRRQPKKSAAFFSIKIKKKERRKKGIFSAVFHWSNNSLGLLARRCFHLCPSLAVLIRFDRSISRAGKTTEKLLR